MIATFIWQPCLFRLQLVATLINLFIYGSHFLSHLAAVLIDPSGRSTWNRKQKVGIYVIEKYDKISGYGTLYHFDTFKVIKTHGAGKI